MGLILIIGGSLFLLIIIVIGFDIITNLDKVIKEIKIYILRKNYKKIIFKIIWNSIPCFIAFLLKKSSIYLNSISNNNAEFSMFLGQANQIIFSLINIAYIFVIVFYIPIITYYVPLFLIKTHLRRKRYRRIKTYIR